MSLLNILCPICTESFKNADDVYSTSCGHLYHFACLNDWRTRQTSCPQCRHYNPTSHKLYLSFEESEHDIQEFKEIQIKLNSSNEKITEVMIQKNEAETNFMHLQQQFTAMEKYKKELEQRLAEMNDFENDFLQLQGQYTTTSALVKDLEYRIQELIIECDSKSRELQIKILENDSLKVTLETTQCDQSDSILKTKIDILEQKFKHISQELEKEIGTSTKLQIEKIKLENYIKNMNAIEKETKDIAVSQNIKTKKNYVNMQSDRTLKKMANHRKNQFDGPNSLFLQDLPLDLVMLPLKNSVINLASKINLKISAEDLIKVNFVKKENGQDSNNELFVEFKNSELRHAFVTRKGILKKDSKMKSIHIGDYMEDEVRGLFVYAKEKLRNHGYEHIYCKLKKVFAKKNRNHSHVITIKDKKDVDMLCEKDTLQHSNMYSANYALRY